MPRSQPLIRGIKIINRINLNFDLMKKKHGDLMTKIEGKNGIERKNWIRLQSNENGIENLDSLGDEILITGGPSSAEDCDGLLPQYEARLIEGVLGPLYQSMIRRAFVAYLKTPKENKWMERMLRPAKFVYRPLIDLDGEGLLIDGRNPVAWIHLGHGGFEDGDPAISVQDEGDGEFIKISEIISHLNSGSGIIWLTLLPICHSREIAHALEGSPKIFATWAPIDQQPTDCHGPLCEFIAEAEEQRSKAAFTTEKPLSMATRGRVITSEISDEDDDFQDYDDDGDDGEVEEEDEDCGDCGECSECHEREEYMSENFPDAWKEASETGMDEDEDECLIPDCHGWIDGDAGAWTDDVTKCSTCGTDYRYCGTCRGWFEDKEYTCPNDH